MSMELNISRREDLLWSQGKPFGTAGATEMFRDPWFFRCLYQEVIPYLASFPDIRIWHAGCSTGEEVYSMGIMMKEAEILHRATLYGTDINPKSLEKAKSGIFPMNLLRLYDENFRLSGIDGRLQTHFHQEPYFSNQVVHKDFQVHKTLQKASCFFHHNLLVDGSFNTFPIIFCRNVLIYYGPEERQRIFNLLVESLQPMGFLCLGKVEEIRALNKNNAFKALKPGLPIYQKIKS